MTVIFLTVNVYRNFDDFIREARNEYSGHILSEMMKSTEMKTDAFSIRWFVNLLHQHNLCHFFLSEISIMVIFKKNPHRSIEKILALEFGRGPARNGHPDREILMHYIISTYEGDPGANNT